MVFKLVRCDTTEPCKIQLPTGTHLIGRGKLLDCDDKRVSRNHGELEVKEDLVTMKALHQNPCFYLKKGLSETQILRHNCNVNLSHGDRFGLLPESYWYEVLLCNVPDISNEPAGNGQEDVSEKKRSIEQNVEEANSDKTIFAPDISPEELEEEFLENENAEMSDARNLIDAVGKDEIPDSPSLLPPESQTSTQEYEPNKQHVAGKSTQEPKVSKSPAKRTHSLEEATETDGTKRVKVEPNIKQELEDAKPGPSNNEGNDSGNKGSASPQSPAKPPDDAPLRERCMYGANCYRRNPQHKVQFSHPGDKDWGPGERGVCPWGAGCGRRDPRHWRDHQHPPGVEPPPPAAHRPGMQVVQRHGNTFYINAHTVNFHDDHFQVEDSDGDSVDYDYEF